MRAGATGIVNKDVTLELDGKEQRLDDVHQGYIGDCFLMAAMGAVVARNPIAIKSRFSPQTPNARSYRVGLFVRGAGGTFEEVAFTVDTKLPTQKDAPRAPAYANLNHGDAPLWPALLEKAYATMIGGYAKTGEGATPATRWRRSPDRRRIGKRYRTRTR
jgi:hypothetical protein